MAELAQTLHARLREQLEARILGGGLRPGDRLPSEAELTREHGVSRITVRQALADLQGKGLIVRLQGKGAFVAPPHASQQLDRLRGLGEALAATGHEVHSRRLSVRTVQARGDVARQLQVAAGTPVVRLQMLRYLDRGPLCVNLSHFAPGLGERVARIDLSGRDLVDVLERDLGRSVGQAQVEISACAMGAAEARLLGVAEGLPALRVDRLVLDGGGEPLHTESATYRADAFSYRLTLAR